jgi:quinone-modifying oxidoreductase subunit QmoB
MKVDENGKELNAEQQHEKYLEYNEGREDILKLDPNGELRCRDLAAGWRPLNPKRRIRPSGLWRTPDVVTNANSKPLPRPAKSPGLPTARKPNRWFSFKARAKTRTMPTLHMPAR